jgi:predicted lipoprotein with Yx(FWY)xxD motif
MRQSNRHAKWGWLAGFAALFLLLAAVPAQADDTAAAAPALQVKSDAQIAADFKLLQGDGNGLTADYLGKATLRYQAAIMSLRLQGLEAEATAYAGSEQFADGSLVFGASRAMLGYLKAHAELGWQGSGDGKFDPLAPVTAQQFYKVMLEGLGYKEGTDFQYDDTLAFAKSKGLYRAAVSATFRNADIATAVVEALKTPVKGGTETLAQTLVKKGAADAAAADALSYKRLEVATDAKLGAYLTDDAGRTLYYFTKDVSDPNSCKAACLGAWPIYDSGTLDVPAGLQAADFGRFLRSDGKTQLTYKGWPLYYYAPDQKPGDVLGEDVNHVWFVLKVPDYSVMLATQASVGGNYLTDNQGRTLYYFDKDTVGNSACSGACLKLWPPFYSPNVVVPTGLDAADFGSITLADGSMATTYKGYPLYYYASDTQRGDTAGQAFKDVWYVVNPATFAGTKAQAAAAGMAN